METIIPEDIFKDHIKEMNNFNYIRNCSCDCGIVNTSFYPYAWDSDNNEVIYMGICPKCGKTLYVRD